MKLLLKTMTGCAAGAAGLLTIILVIFFALVIASLPWMVWAAGHQLLAVILGTAWTVFWMKDHSFIIKRLADYLLRPFVS